MLKEKQLASSLSTALLFNQSTSRAHQLQAFLGVHAITTFDWFLTDNVANALFAAMSPHCLHHSMEENHLLIPFKFMSVT
jgi:hypothetical protein